MNCAGVTPQPPISSICCFLKSHPNFLKNTSDQLNTAMPSASVNISTCCFFLLIIVANNKTLKSEHCFCLSISNNSLQNIFFNHCCKFPQLNLRSSGSPRLVDPTSLELDSTWGFWPVKSVFPLHFAHWWMLFIQVNCLELRFLWTGPLNKVESNRYLRSSHPVACVGNIGTEFWEEEEGGKRGGVGGGEKLAGTACQIQQISGLSHRRICALTCA